MLTTSPAFIRLRVASPLLVVCALIVAIARLIPSDALSAQAREQPIPTLAPIIMIATAQPIPPAEEAQEVAPVPAVEPLIVPTALPFVQDVPPIVNQEPPAPIIIYQPVPVIDAAPTPEWIPPMEPTVQPIDPVLNDPAQNGGSISPPNCPFPILNGECGNGQLASDVSEEGTKIDTRQHGNEHVAQPNPEGGSHR